MSPQEFKTSETQTLPSTRLLKAVPIQTPPDETLRTGSLNRNANREIRRRGYRCPKDLHVQRHIQFLRGHVRRHGRTAVMGNRAERPRWSELRELQPRQELPRIYSRECCSRRRRRRRWGRGVSRRRRSPLGSSSSPPLSSPLCLRRWFDTVGNQISP